MREYVCPNCGGMLGSCRCTYENRFNLEKTKICPSCFGMHQGLCPKRSALEFGKRFIFNPTEEIIELPNLPIDTRTCAFQGEPEGFGVLKRTPCTYGRPDDGDKPSSAFDANKRTSADNDFDISGRNSEKFMLNIISTPSHPRTQPERIRTCLATWLPDMAQNCSKFQKRETKD